MEEKDKNNDFIQQSGNSEQKDRKAPENMPFKYQGFHYVFKSIVCSSSFSLN